MPPRVVPALTPACRLRGALLRAQEAFYLELDTVTLADLVEGNLPLAEILACDVRPACAPSGAPSSTTSATPSRAPIRAPIRARAETAAI